MKKIIIARSIMRAIDGENTMLGRGTMTTFTARTSEEMLNLHGVHRADLIVTEADLPLMGGVKLCSVIRNDADLKKVSIIMVCGGTEELKAQCRDVRANSIIPKPIDPVRFFSKVSELLVIPERKDLRVLLRASIKGQDEKSFFGMSHNISISGMLMETDRGLREGDRLTCSFTLGTREIVSECRVVRVATSSGRFRCGVAFLNLDTKSLIIIEQFVKAGRKR